MCKIYNTIGSLNTIKSRLVNNDIYDFKSLKEVIDFQKSYTTYLQQEVSRHEYLIEQEKIRLNLELQQLETAINTQRQQSEERLNYELNTLKWELNNSTNSARINFFQKLTKGLKDRSYKRKIKERERNFDTEVNRSISDLVYNYQIKSNRYQFISSKVNEAVRESAQYDLSELERKKATIDELNSYIYGALGEQKVVKTLETLSDEYFLINDFAVSFRPAIYNRQEGDYIKSVQIDHILVGPSGIFLIETKNWSEKSLENLSLYSPVHQIKRTSFVLFKVLNNEISNYRLRLDHHWGDRKVPIKNLIVLINSKPKEEFQYVKILTINELPGYVKYFKPVFSNAETERIAEFLADINEQKTIVTRRN